MFKRLLVLLLTLCLFLSASALADNAIALPRTHVYEDIFSINYPDDWRVHQIGMESTATDKECGLLYSPEDTGLNMEIFVFYVDSMADANVTQMSSDELTAYALETIELEKALQFSFADFVVTHSAPSIIFLVCNGADEQGQLFIAETVLDGWITRIYGYAYTDGTYTACRDLTSEDYALFKAIVESYTPLNLE